MTTCWRQSPTAPKRPGSKSSPSPPKTSREIQARRESQPERGRPDPRSRPRCCYGCHQGLPGAADEILFEVCGRERRALNTLDRDFGQVLRYPPAASAGIVILEIGRRTTHPALLDRVRELLRLLDTRSPEGALWIVEPGRLRIHLPSDDEAQ